jgi:hypothetical protein
MLTKNQLAPAIRTTSVSGQPINLSTLRGKREVLIKFHRFSGCPVARCQIDDLLKRQDELNAAASKPSSSCTAGQRRSCLTSKRYRAYTSLPIDRRPFTGSISRDSCGGSCSRLHRGARPSQHSPRATSRNSTDSKEASSVFHPISSLTRREKSSTCTTASTLVIRGPSLKF